ncbi:hypothetical protein [Atribacter laminatus]|nr:hypothetical protein [Atribacter laminatus]
MLMNNLFTQKKEINKKERAHEDGFMLLEVVIVIVITVMLMTTLYQFFGFMNKKSRSQITDQVLSDSINVFLSSISRDIRTANYIKFNNSNEIYIENELGLNNYVSNTYNFLSDSIEKNNLKIISGMTNSSINYQKSTFYDNSKDVYYNYYSKITITLSTPHDNYSTLVVRRNPPSVDE